MVVMARASDRIMVLGREVYDDRSRAEDDDDGRRPNDDVLGRNGVGVRFPLR